MPAGRANNLGVTTQQLYRWVEYGLHCQSVQVKRLGLIYQIESILYHLTALDIETEYAYNLSLKISM